MRYFLLLLLFSCSTTAFAQFGITAYANFNNDQVNVPEPGVNEFLDYKVGSEVALHYWFRLPKKRIEFQPTVFYAAAKSTNEVLNLTEIGVQFKTNFYLFDFGTDCNCPTFGKQGPSLQKGLFLQLTPGYSFYNLKSTTPLIRDLPANGFTLGGAVGIDFGISNLVTITPIAGFRYGLQNYADIQFTDVNGNSIGVGKLQLLTYQIGLQATFRLDKRRY